MVPPQLFTSILGLFTGKLKVWAWGAVALVLVGGFSWWSLSTIKSLKRENETMSLKYDNRRLTAENAQREAERLEMIGKMDAMSESVGRLSQAYGRNAVGRQQSFDSMTGPISQRPDGTVDTQPLQDRANTGMNKLFSDLMNLSRESTK